MGRRRDVFRPFGLIHQIGSLAPSFWQIWMRFSCFRRCKSGPNILKESAAGISKRPGPEPPGPEPPGPERPGPKGTSCPLKILGREGGREGRAEGGGEETKRGKQKQKKGKKKKLFWKFYQQAISVSQKTESLESGKLRGGNVKAAVRGPWRLRQPKSVALTSADGRLHRCYHHCYHRCKYCNNPIMIFKRKKIHHIETEKEEEEEGKEKAI